jgi:hypothetical protein
MVLPLFGDDGSGAGHDWHNVLGAFGLLQQIDVLAGLVTATARRRLAQKPRGFRR